MKDQGRWWICGEWCQGPYKTQRKALRVLKGILESEVLRNQFWSVEKKGRNKPW